MPELANSYCYYGLFDAFIPQKSKLPFHIPLWNGTLYCIVKCLIA